MARKTNASRMFRFGEAVRIKKKSRVVDKERKHEGKPAGTLPPIDHDITGEQGNVCADSYFSEEKGEVCVPMQLPNEAVVAVPESRLERVGPTAVTRDGGGQSSPSPLSRETLEFWEGKLKERERAIEDKESKR